MSEGDRHREAPPTQTSETDDLGWLAALPAAGLIVAAIVWLAPALARLMYPDPSWRPYPNAVQLGLIRPEGVEQTQYLVAAIGPFVVLATWLGLRAWYQRRQRPTRIPTWYVLVVQVAIAAFVAVCWISQRRSHQWFDGSTLLIAAGLGVGLVALARRGWIVPGAAGEPAPVRRRQVRWVAGVGVAIALTGYWLLPAVYRTPNAVSVASLGELRQIQFLQDELASVLTGRTPMVDFASQYSKLLPFAAAPVLATLGPSIGVTTGILAALGVLGLLAVYGIFVVITEDPLAALALYIPFLALTLFTYLTVGDERLTLASLFGVVPIRVVGPFLLGWLVSRRLRKGGDRSAALLFAGAGLVAVNNTEFGAASFAAVGLALWCGRDRQSSDWARARALASQAAIGGALALVAVSALTLVRSGSLPDIRYITNLTRVFAIEGFGMEPIRPTLGLHLIIYLTFVVALVTGVMGARRPVSASPRDRVMSGMLAYSGLLGLGAGAYWVGRSHPSALFGMFPTWGLSVALLVWAVLREAASRRRISVRHVLPATGALVAFGLMATVIVQIPSPASQLRRFTADGLDGLVVPQYAASVEFIADRTERGERVVILAPTGHVMARDIGVVDVSPFADEASIVFYEQMDLLLDTMERNGATTVFVSATWPETSAYLAEKGYVITISDAASGLTEWRMSRS